MTDTERERAELVSKLEGLRPQVKSMMNSFGANEPDWGPLERVLPLEWCAGFMFMGYADKVRMYKQGFTRRYINIDPYGNCYEYDSRRDRYSIVPTDVAIEHVFGGLEDMGWKRTSPYNEKNARERRERLAAAGWRIVSFGPHS
jgi:hypothetical protein